MICVLPVVCIKLIVLFSDTVCDVPVKEKQNICASFCSVESHSEYLHMLTCKFSTESAARRSSVFLLHCFFFAPDHLGCVQRRNNYRSCDPATRSLRFSS